MRTRNLVIGLAAAAALVAFGLVAWLGPSPDGPPPGLDPSQYGWAGPEAVREAKPLVDLLPAFRILDEPGVSQATGPVNVRLWQAERKLGVRIPNVRQEVGDCVSWGYRNAVARLLAVGMATGSIRGEFHDPYPPYIYGTSRVLVGGGRLSGDGSVGAWAQEAVKRFGVLASDAPNVPGYSGAIARAWGDRPGPPKTAIEWAQSFRVETTAAVRSAEDVAAAITNGYPVPICSDFGTRTFRVADGRRIAVGDGSWNHCMCLLAYDETAPSGERYFYCLNSWGDDAHPAPLGDEPKGGFWLTWDQVERIARQGDSFALSNFRGFPARRIDFRILAKSSAAEEGGRHAQHLRGSTLTGGIRRRAFDPAGRSERLPAARTGRRDADDPGRLAGRRPAVVPAARPGGSTDQPGPRGDVDRLPRERSRDVGIVRGLADVSARRLAGDGPAAGADVRPVADHRHADYRPGRDEPARVVWCQGEPTGLLDARRGVTLGDRDLDGAAVSHCLLHAAALPELQAPRSRDVAGVDQGGLARGHAADRSPADLRGQGWSAGGGGSGLRPVRDRLTPYPDPAVGGAGDRPDRRPQGDAAGEYGWIRPADLGQELRPLDGRGPVEVDEREQAGAELFGPSAAELRALTDRAVDRTLGGAGRAIEAKAKELAWSAAAVGLTGCACTGATCGLVVVIARLVGWLLRGRRRQAERE